MLVKGVPRAGAILRLGDQEGRFIHRARDQMGESIWVRPAQKARCLTSAEPFFQRPQPEFPVDRAPFLPAQHGRGVEEGNLTELVVQRDLEERFAARDERLQRLAGGIRLCLDSEHQILLDDAEDGLEEPFLAAEVVVHGALAEADAVGDPFDGGLRVPELGELAPRPLQERIDRCLAPLGVRARCALRGRSL